MRTAQKRDEAESDLALLARVQAGDPEAFETIYRLYSPRLARFLRRFVAYPQLTEEIIHETLLVVWDRPQTFSGESKLSTWIFGIAYRKALRALRTHEEPIEDPGADERASLDPTPEDALGRQRARVLLLQAVGALSHEHRAVVEHSYFDGMRYRDIAELMGCPVDTVKTRMYYARRQLKRILAGELPDWL